MSHITTTTSIERGRIGSGSFDSIVSVDGGIFTPPTPIFSMAVQSFTATGNPFGFDLGGTISPTSYLGEPITQVAAFDDLRFTFLADDYGNHSAEPIYINLPDSPLPDLWIEIIGGEATLPDSTIYDYFVSVENQTIQMQITTVKPV